MSWGDDVGDSVSEVVLGVPCGGSNVDSFLGGGAGEDGVGDDGEDGVGDGCIGGEREETARGGAGGCDGDMGATLCDCDG